MNNLLFKKKSCFGKNFFRLRLTLLELIISIVVMLILLTLISTVVSRARFRAAETRELAELKQLTAAIMNYTGSHPQACFENPDIPQFLYDINLTDHIIKCRIEAVSFTNALYYHCYNSNGFLFHRYRGEAYENWKMEEDELYPQMLRPVAYSRIRNPGKKIILSEADDLEQIEDFPMLGAFYPGFSFFLAEQHHRNKTPCAWADGHVTFETDAHMRFMETQPGAEREEYTYLEPEL